MNTRTTTNQDPANAPERNLSSLRLRPINISLAVAAQAARAYAKPAREACLWLANLAANSQRIQLCWQRRLLPDPIGTVGRITEADLCSKLGLLPIEVYRALTGHEDADLERFVAAVTAFRFEFESKLPPLIRTKDTPQIEAAFSIAGDEHRITLVQSKTRHGKTEESERNWLRNLHRCVWLDCPEDNTERSFLDELARVLGIGANVGKRPPVMRQQIKRALGIGLIDTVIIDEAHNLWPENLLVKPKRAEFVRHLRDSLGVGFVLVATDQFATAMEIAKAHNERYAPGQFAGRRYQFVLRETHTEKEVRAIAALHSCNLATEAALDALVIFAEREEGYLGLMIEAIAAARRFAGNNSSQINADHVARAIRQQQTEQRVKDLALTANPVRKSKGKFRLVA